MAECRSTDYYDIVFVGKTGSGKSTTGNKILGIGKSGSTSGRKIKLFASTHIRTSLEEKSRFVEANDYPEESVESTLSVTDRCKLLSDETSSIDVPGLDKKYKLRVLDVPGFADTGQIQEITGETQKVLGIYEANLQIVRWITRIQKEVGIHLRRLVYMLPTRGPLDKADRVLQDELKALHHFFGKEIFECMILAGTNYSNPRYQTKGMEFNEDDIRKAQKIFKTAVQLATDVQIVVPPPVVYIGYSEEYTGERILGDILAAKVANNRGIQLEIPKTTCARCGVKVEYTTAYINDALGQLTPERRPFGVVNSYGLETPYNQSKCHPGFGPKYSATACIAGGVGHFLTLGIPILIGWGSWPGFTNSDEACTNAECKKSPGSAGCVLVGQVVKHTNKL